MKRSFLFALAIILMASCTNNSKEYIIHGVVSDPSLEGAQMFLVPMENVSSETIDSVYVKDMKFEFRGTEEKVAELRVERMKRIGMENLLVVTEPGDIHVTIGNISTGMGTPQNDSLQVWKSLTMQFNQQYNNFLRQNRVEDAKALREVYIARTHQMADNVGEGSTLALFLNKLYPNKQ